MNSVNLTGRLVHDPTRRETHRGVVASFRLAVDGRPRVWIDVEAWGHLAGTVATYLRARRHIGVTGHLAYSEYHDRNGHKQASFRIVADRIGFLDLPTFIGDISRDTENGAGESEPDRATTGSPKEPHRTPSSQLPDSGSDS
jgi:single-stranded DNA-binding protein